MLALTRSERFREGDPTSCIGVTTVLRVLLFFCGSVSCRIVSRERVASSFSVVVWRGDEKDGEEDITGRIGRVLSLLVFSPSSSFTVVVLVGGAYFKS